MVSDGGTMKGAEVMVGSCCTSGLGSRVKGGISVYTEYHVRRAVNTTTITVNGCILQEPF